MVIEMKSKPRYESSPRNNYGAVDYIQDNKVVYTAFAGIQPQKLADKIEGELNEAVSKGFAWATKIIKDCKENKTDKEILSCIYSEFGL
jgi:hypothetical protein